MMPQCGWKVFGGQERFCVYYPGHTGPHMDFIDARETVDEVFPMSDGKDPIEILWWPGSSEMGSEPHWTARRGNSQISIGEGSTPEAALSSLLAIEYAERQTGDEPEIVDHRGNALTDEQLEWLEQREAVGGAK